jgi:hypothetical protein
MNAQGERRLAMAFGLLGALLLVVAALLDLIRGFVLLATGSGSYAFGTWSASIILIVVALLAGFFASIGRSRDRSLASGVVLVVVAVAGWLLLGLASGVLPLLGSLFILIAGILFLVPER